MDYRRLEGKCAVITGAAGGIAISTALSFAAEGAAVSLTDIDQAGVEKAVSRSASTISLTVRALLCFGCSDTWICP